MISLDALHTIVQDLLKERGPKASAVENNDTKHEDIPKKTTVNANIWKNIKENADKAVNEITLSESDCKEKKPETTTNVRLGELTSALQSLAVNGLPMKKPNKNNENKKKYNCYQKLQPQKEKFYSSVNKIMQLMLREFWLLASKKTFTLLEKVDLFEATIRLDLLYELLCEFSESESIDEKTKPTEFLIMSDFKKSITSALVKYNAIQERVEGSN